MSALFSVVVPTRNRAPLLRPAVESVLVQERPALELIVVDDASKDGTGRLLDSLQRDTTGRTPLRVIRHEVARGAAAARNRGVREAQGPWIGFLDDDDRYGTGYLDAMHHLLEDAPPSVGFAWSGVRRLRDTPQGAVVESEQYWDPRFADRRAAFRGFVAGRRVGSGCGLVVRRSSFLAAGGFDEALPCAEDTDLLIRLARDFDFRVCREILVDVHLHDGPRLTRYGAPMATAYARILDKNRPALADAPAVLAGLQYKTGWLHYRAGDRLGGRRHVVAALRTRPRFAKAWLALVLFEVLGSHGAGIHDRLSWLRKGGP